MIGRFWRGCTASAENADGYEELLRGSVLPGLWEIDGYKGAYVLRRDVEGGVEFVVITLWESMEAVQAFAGAHTEGPVVTPEARKLLLTFDQTAVHYEIVIQPDQGGSSA